MATGPNFAILGVRKLKTRSELASRAAHHLREHQVPNADASRSASNATTWKASARELADAVLKRTEPLVKRRDAVRAVEVLLTASPEWFTQHGGAGNPGDLAKAARKWLDTTFGVENVVAIGYHGDERTPHIWAMVTPIAGGKLKASHWLDGPKKLSELHTTWAAATEHLGLVRGAERSPARHVEVRTFYAAARGSTAAAQKLEREMARRAYAARQRADDAEAAATKAEERLAQIADREQQVEVNRRRAELLLEALTPQEQYQAAERFEKISARSTPPPAPERVVARSTGPAFRKKP